MPIEGGMTDSIITVGTYYIINTPLTNFLTASYTGTRNNCTQAVGYEFVPTQNITLTALGRSVSGSMTQNHPIRIWQVSDQTIVAMVTVTPSSAIDTLGYKYVALDHPGHPDGWDRVSHRLG